MPLNKVKGNMFPFVTHTWNTCKGECPHDCKYCYMKRFKQSPLHFDEKELKTNLGEGNFIFVGSSCDMFAAQIPTPWIINTYETTIWNKKNHYLFQTKNPNRYRMFLPIFTKQTPFNYYFSITLESNRIYPDCKALRMRERVADFKDFKFRKMITVEPIMDFDLIPFVEMIKNCNPEQVNIGALTGGKRYCVIPEPSKDKTLDLIVELEKFTKVVLKKNLDRIIRR